jgi:hypothetical protein
MLVWTVTGRGGRDPRRARAAHRAGAHRQTIVPVLDPDADTAYTAVTAAEGAFMRLTGRIDRLNP